VTSLLAAHHPGPPLAPSIITGLAALAGVVISVIGGLVLQWRNRRWVPRNRWNEALRANFAETFGAMDDLSLIVSHSADLDPAAPDSATKRREIETTKAAAWTRINLALASVDLLAPQDVCDLGTDASAHAELPLDDPDRVAAMEAFVTATRKHLGIKPHVWKQRV
jgi:hypothetical protein